MKPATATLAWASWLAKALARIAHTIEVFDNRIEFRGTYPATGFMWRTVLVYH